MPKTSLFLFSFSIILGYCFKANLDFQFNNLLFIILIFLLYLNIKNHKFKKKILATIIFILIILFSPSYLESDIVLNNNQKLGRQELSVWICKDVKENYYRQEIVLCFRDQEIKERIISWWPLYPKLKFGDKLIINCNLSLPSNFSDFDYKSFLASQKIYYTCSFPSLIKREENYKISFFKSKLETIKQSIKRLVKRNLPEPQAGLVLAMFLGDRREMSESLVENFRISGIGHLTAVSGTHINLISLFLLFILLFFGLKKKIALLPLIFILAFYVLLVGAKSSALRALLMSSFALLAWRNNRLIHPLSILSASAAIFLIFDYKSLIDIAWQLSFSAVLGIILFLPIFNDIKEKILKIISYSFIKISKALLLAFFVSLSVQIMIWPLLAWHFNYVSLLSVFSNIIVFPIFSLLMFLLIPTIFLSYFIEPISWYLFSPIYFLSKILINLVEFISSFSSLYINLENISLYFIILYYFLLRLIYRKIKKQARK